MEISRYGVRRAKNIIAQLLAILAAIFGLFWLVWILWTTLHNGLASLNIALFTQMTPPPGESGGMLNAFFGSALMSAVGIALGAPIGVLAGTFLAEYSQKSWLGETVRFVNDILLSAPSIVLGLFVYTLVDGTFFRAGRLHRTGLHRITCRGAHYRRDAAAGARADA
jgi:phosphate transport system permease protein